MFQTMPSMPVLALVMPAVSGCITRELPWLVYRSLVSRFRSSPTPAPPGANFAGHAAIIVRTTKPPHFSFNHDSSGCETTRRGNGPAFVRYRKCSAVNPAAYQAKHTGCPASRHTSCTDVAFDAFTGGGLRT